MSINSPKFYFNEDGFIFCASFEGHLDTKKLYTCLDCDKYSNHLCDFGILHAEKVLKQLSHLKFERKCGLCGNNITNYWALLYYRYLESVKKIQTIPLCCSCFYALKNNHWENRRENKKDLIKIQTVYAFGGIFFGFLSILRSIDLYNFRIWLGILISMLGVILFGVGIKILIENIQNRIFLKKGLQLYNYLSVKEDIP